MRKRGIHPDIRTRLVNGKHLDLLTHNLGQRRQIVDFKQDVVLDETNSGNYCVMLESGFSSEKGNEVGCILGTHGNPKKQVLLSASFKSLRSFNLELNERFRNALDRTDIVGSNKLAVCYGNHIFVCSGLTGTVYIVWAKHINFTNYSNVASTIDSDVPMIVNMDGQMKVKGIYFLKPTVHDASDLERIPISTKSPEIIFEIKCMPWVAEVREEKPPRNTIQTLTYKQAVARVTSPSTLNSSSQQQIERESNPFGASVDFEDDSYPMGFIIGGSGSRHNISASFNYGSDPDAGTPRDTLYCQEINMDVRNLERTPPVALSDGEPDPYLERARNPRNTIPSTAAATPPVSKKEKEEEEEHRDAERIV